MTPKNVAEPPDDESRGVLDDAASLDTTGIGILGHTAQVSVQLPKDDDDALEDDGVVEGEVVADLIVDEPVAAAKAAAEISEVSLSTPLIIELPAEQAPPPREASTVGEEIESGPVVEPESEPEDFEPVPVPVSEPELSVVPAEAGGSLSALEAEEIVDRESAEDGETEVAPDADVEIEADAEIEAGRANEADVEPDEVAEQEAIAEDPSEIGGATAPTDPDEPDTSGAAASQSAASEPETQPNEDEEAAAAAAFVARARADADTRTRADDLGGDRRKMPS